MVQNNPLEHGMRLHNYLVKIRFLRTNDNNNIYLKTNDMNKEFEISMFGEINFFVGLQVYQMKQGIYLTQ